VSHLRKKPFRSNAHFQQGEPAQLADSGSHFCSAGIANDFNEMLRMAIRSLGELGLKAKK
jgi:hypothetical protein